MPLTRKFAKQRPKKLEKIISLVSVISKWKKYVKNFGVDTMIGEDVIMYTYESGFDQ